METDNLKTRPCFGCGEPIGFVKSIKGKMVPVNPELITLITENGYFNKGYVPHYMTCSNNEDFKNKE